MSTFNAGAIEAQLTLDRSPFNREMRAAQAQARRFEARKINPEIRLKGKEELTEAEALLKAIGDERVNVQIDIDGREQILETALLISNLDGRNIDLNVDVDAAKALAELGMIEGVVSALDGRNIDLDIDADAGGGLTHAVSGFSRMQALVTAVLVLLPLVPPVVATLTAALVGLAAGLTAAGGALAVVGLGVFPTVKGMMDLNTEIQKQKTRLDGLEPGTKAYADQQAKINRLQQEMNTRYGEASKGLVALKDAYAGFVKATEGPSQALIGSFFQMLATIVPKLVPIFNAAAPVIQGALDGIANFAKGPEMDRVVAFFRDFGSKALGDLLSIGGNVLQFLGRLFEAFAPFGSDLLDDIENLTAGWAEWADGIGKSKGFQEFIDYVKVEGPKVWQLIKDIVGAFINLGVALAPVGSAALDAFSAVFDFIENLDPDILGAIVVGLGVATVAILVMTAAFAVLNAVLALNPFTLIVIAIIALIAAIVYLWNTNEGFREAIIGAWNAVRDAVAAVVDWFSSNVLPVLQSIWDGIKSGFQSVADVINPIVSLISQIVQQAFHNMMAVVGPVMSFIVGGITLGFNAAKAVVMTVLPIIIAIVSGGFNAMRAVVSAVMNVIMAIWGGAWGIIRAVFTTVINVIKAVLTTVLAAMRGDVSGVLNGIKGIFSAVWNGIKSIVSAAVNAVKGVVTAGMNGVKSVVSSIMNAVANVFRTAWNTVKSVVSGGISAIRGMFAGAGSWLVGAGRAIIQGLINGIRAMAGAVKSAVSSVLSAARNLLPFSPAKEGPFSGRGWTLYSGRSIVEAMAQGVSDRKQMLVNRVRETMEAARPEAGSFGVGIRNPIALANANPNATGRTINVELKSYNPLPEAASQTAVKEITMLANLGVFG